MNVPPVSCHQDDVINTLIQPGTPGFQYNVQVPDHAAAGTPIGTIRTCMGSPNFK